MQKCRKKCDYTMISLAYGVYYMHSTHVKYGRLSWIAFFIVVVLPLLLVLFVVCMNEGKKGRLNGYYLFAAILLHVRYNCH